MVHGAAGGGSDERLLAGLTGAQRRAVTSEAGVLCVAAGAGSGKTTVLTRRVAWRVAMGNAEADHVLVVTFTRKAASELRGRLRRLGVAEDVQASTFHAAAFSQLRRHWADRGVTPPAVMADPGPMLAQLLGEAGGSPVLVPAVAAELSWARARGLSPEQYLEACETSGRRVPISLDKMGELFTSYAERKRRRGVVDLDDLVAQCTELLHNDPAAAAAVRWRVRHLFVDEFQDVNPAQWQLLEAWRDRRPDLTVVGDARQAIYAWNGSDTSLLARLPSLMGEIETVRLEENHRSTPQIVGAAAAVLEPSPSEHRPLPMADDGPPPVLHGFEAEADEARAVAAWLRSLRRPGQPWGHLAVLARTHARLLPLADALRSAGIPHTPSSGRRPASQADLLRALRRLAPTTPVHAGLLDAVEEVGDTDDARVVVGNLRALTEEHAAEEMRPTVGSFLSWLAANSALTEQVADGDGGDRRGGSGVTLATFHQAKGLEWTAVAVVGLEEGTMPFIRAVGAEALAEERRLLYVALTRAQRDLWCSWAAVGAAGAGRQPSPFLEALPAAISSGGPVEQAVALDRLGELRDLLAAAG